MGGDRGSTVELTQNRFASAIRRVYTRWQRNFANQGDGISGVTWKSVMVPKRLSAINSHHRHTALGNLPGSGSKPARFTQSRLVTVRAYPPSALSRMSGRMLPRCPLQIR